jgi:predicted AAA+ superfamily ATPase
MKTLFEICTPRADVIAGNIRESDFAANLAQVLNGTAPREYLDPAVFFANTHPTDGLHRLLHNVLTRLSGKGARHRRSFGSTRSTAARPTPSSP